MEPELLAGLRELCREYGDNDWPDNLHPLDVIEKHLTRPLYSQLERMRETVAALTERNAKLESAMRQTVATLTERSTKLEDARRQLATIGRHSPTGG